MEWIEFEIRTHKNRWKNESESLFLLQNFWENLLKYVNDSGAPERMMLIHFFLHSLLLILSVYIKRGLLTQRNPRLELHETPGFIDRRMHDSYMFIKRATCRLFSFNFHYICCVNCYCCNRNEEWGMRNDNFEWTATENREKKNAIKLELPASIFLGIWDNISLWTRSSGFTDPEECIGSGAIISETFDE